MSLFEYLSIAISLVLSFAAVRLLGGLPHAMAKNRRYWIHLTAIVILLVMVMGVFWAFWSYREVVWNFPKFILLMTMPSTLYFMCASIIPENPEAIESWQDYYYSVRVQYYAGVCLFALAIIVSTTVVLNMPWSHPGRVTHVFFFIVGFLGVSTANERIHASIVSFTIFMMIFLVTTLYLQPGSLSR